jgi:threonyl-tRNA synthetase
MFIAQVEDEDKFLALKPMSCPCHVQIFNHRLRSYRELPLRMAEFGSCHRYEPSGALHGIMRVRAFTQDDAHIFCTEDQIATETARFVDLWDGLPRSGFRGRSISLPTGNRIGSDEAWDCRGALRSCAIAGVDATEPRGAPSGPGLEFVLRDAIGRDWQCGTLRVDPSCPNAST